MAVQASLFLNFFVFSLRVIFIFLFYQKIAQPVRSAAILWLLSLAEQLLMAEQLLIFFQMPAKPGAGRDEFTDNDILF